MNSGEKAGADDIGEPPAGVTPTAFMLDHLVQKFLIECDLTIRLVTGDQHAWNAHYTIDSLGRPLFTGTMDRCSDFVRGFHFGIKRRMG